jgi:hypothetical protein
MVAGTAAMAFAGCTFGDEPPPQEAQSVVGPWFDQNCVPAECMYQCCQGWAYRPKPSLRGGNVPNSVCGEVQKRNAVYSEYVYLMNLLQNYCPDDFKYWESGYCYVIEPPDVIEGFSLDDQPVYSGLSFFVCSPKGSPAAYPMEDVEFIRQE